MLSRTPLILSTVSYVLVAGFHPELVVDCFFRVAGRGATHCGTAGGSAGAAARTQSGPWQSAAATT